MEWKRYYEEKEVVPLSAQVPYYRYVLEQLEGFVMDGKDETEELTVVLGGLHPRVTRPEHFESLCRNLFKNPLAVVILDQNKEALKECDEEKYLVRQAKLEQFPDGLGLVDLLICDYTADFMSDGQLREMNVNFPLRVSDNGLLVMTIDNPSFPIFSQASDLFRFGIKTFPRSVERLKNLLTNFKLILDARTGNHNDLLIFAKKEASIEEFEGLPIGLFPDVSPFKEWLLKNNQY